jgi:hypothetical protein
MPLQVLQLQARLGEVRECNCAPRSLPSEGSSDPLEFHSPQPQSSQSSLPLFYEDSFYGPGPLRRVTPDAEGEVAAGTSSPSPPPLPVRVRPPTPHPLRFRYSTWRTDERGSAVPWHPRPSEPSTCESDYHGFGGGFRSASDEGCGRCEGCWRGVP